MKYFFFLALLIPSISFADVGESLKSFFESSGGGVNVTKPSFYNGQRAGFATMGSVQVRTRPRNSDIANLQLPSVQAGCGGIDIFGGSFSFISKEELIKMMEAIMQNSAAFAFELALDSMSPAISERVSQLRALHTQINNMNINSCELGQSLTASIWPQMDGASQRICQSIGSFQGQFSDRIASRHGCSQSEEKSSVLNSAKGSLKDQVPVNVNYAWNAAMKNSFLRDNKKIAEFFVNLTGTTIIIETSDGSTQVKHIYPLATDKSLINILINGGEAQIHRCEEYDSCLPMLLGKVKISEKDSLRYQVSNVISSIKDSIVNSDSTISDGAVNVLGMTSIPILDLIITSLSFQHIFVESEIDAISEVVAVDLAMIYIEESLKEMSKSASYLTIYGNETERFQKQIKLTQQNLSRLKQEANERYSHAMRTLERLSLAKKELASYSSSRFAAMISE